MKYAIAIFLLAFSLTAWAQGSLEVRVDNVRKASGTVRVGLFSNEKDFLKKPIAGKVVKADANSVTVVFTDLQPGDYAVSVIHDENENGELDSNALGMPKEGFAFGNNSMGMFGPPSFKEAKIEVRSKMSHTIKLRYF